MTRAGRRGSIAQLVRAPALQAGGRGFESLCSHKRARTLLPPGQEAHRIQRRPRRWGGMRRANRQVHDPTATCRGYVCGTAGAATLPDMRFSKRDPSQAVSAGALVARFSIAGLLVMGLLAMAIALLAREAARTQAINSAQQVTAVTAYGIAEPRLTPAVVGGDPGALRSFDDAMRRFVLRGSLVRVKLWNADGRVIYSDESRLIGQTFTLGENERMTLLQQGRPDSEVSDLSRTENTFELQFGKLLEVYVGVRSTTGEPLLFEAYFRYDAVEQAVTQQLKSYAPPALAALLLLQLVQIPFAWSLARRLERQQQDRQQLLQHAVDASDAERRRIAGDLHDGVVQHLTGVTFALDAARLQGPDPDRDTELVRTTATQLRSSTAALRSLLV